MANKIGGYRDEDSLVATAATHTLRLHIEEPIKRTFVEGITVHNSTTAGTTVAVGIEVGGLFVPVITLVMTTATYFYSQHIHAYLFPGEILRFDFAGLTAADVVKAFAFGYHEYGE